MAPREYSWIPDDGGRAGVTGLLLDHHYCSLLSKHIAAALGDDQHVKSQGVALHESLEWEAGS